MVSMRGESEKKRSRCADFKRKQASNNSVRSLNKEDCISQSRVDCGRSCAQDIITSTQESD